LGGVPDCHAEAMPVSTVTTFFAVLTLAANAGVIVIAAAALTGRLPALRTRFADAGLPVAWLVALVATAGSLYYSEIANFTPCTLCWYQRIAMYPLVVILGIATVAGDRAVHRYVWPVAAVGAGIAAFHYLLEWFPVTTALCDPAVPCSVAWFRELGFISLPYMALSAFALIVALLLLAKERL
jgi:disulfide bond formation protein DsbB